MKLEIVALQKAADETVSIEQSALKRRWMDNTADEYAYRCLPLNIANQHGWAVYPKNNIVASWTGDSSIERDGVKVYDDPNNLAVSHFGHGILTFTLPFLVKLDPGYSLYITGAPNHFIKGIQPCTGIFEADWAPYSFTMNWKFTHANEPVTFTPKDPICFFFPVPRNIVPDTKTKYSTFDEQEDDYKAKYQAFVDKRDNFNVEEYPDGWQKHYFQGLYADGTKCPFDHKTKIKAGKF